MFEAARLLEVLRRRRFVLAVVINNDGADVLLWSLAH
jgi:hypothetical protein